MYVRCLLYFNVNNLICAYVPKASAESGFQYVFILVVKKYILAYARKVFAEPVIYYCFILGSNI